MKTKTCKFCKAKFVPERPLQVVCGFDCANSKARQDRIKHEAKEATKKRKERSKALEDAKPRAQWMKEAQQVVNKYVRLRDFDKGCVSCDKPKTWNGQWHASHFKSVGANSALRFNLWNIHKSCSQCNKWLSGNISEYTKRIVDRIGDEKLEWIESHNISRKYDIDYLKRLKSVFAEKCKKLEKKLSIR